METQNEVPVDIRQISMKSEDHHTNGNQPNPASDHEVMSIEVNGSPRKSLADSIHDAIPSVSGSDTFSSPSETRRPDIFTGSPKAMKVSHSEITDSISKFDAHAASFRSPAMIEGMQNRTAVRRALSDGDNLLYSPTQDIVDVQRVMSFNALDKHEAFRESVKMVARDLTKKYEQSLRLHHPPGPVSGEVSMRDTIRRAHAENLVRAPFSPYSGMLKIKKLRWKEVDVTLDDQKLVWKRREKVVKEIQSNDIFAGQKLEGNLVKVHVFFMRKSRKLSKRVRRYRKEFLFQASNEEEANHFVECLNSLVKWLARVPKDATRKIMCIVNPHSGKRTGNELFQNQLKPLLELANIHVDKFTTDYASHAVDLGREFSLDSGYESVIFVSGDGTVNQFINGIFSKPESEWRKILGRVALTLVCGGTQNGFANAIGVPNLEAAVFAAVTRKIRPIDVLSATSLHDPTKNHLSLCGVVWGIPGDVAEEGERHRHLGIYRYAYLAIKRFVVKQKKHTGKLRFVPLEPQPELKTYDEVFNDQNVVEDQFLSEAVDFYEQDPIAAGWVGDSSAIFKPADESHFHDSQWKEEEGPYYVVAAFKMVDNAKYLNPSDGNLDLVMVRKSGWLDMFQFVYCGIRGKLVEARMIKYLKCKAIIIVPENEQDVCNIDGEVLSGPGPFKIEVIPSVLNVLTEK